MVIGWLSLSWDCRRGLGQAWPLIFLPHSGGSLGDGAQPALIPWTVTGVTQGGLLGLVGREVSAMGLPFSVGAEQSPDRLNDRFPWPVIWYWGVDPGVLSSEAPHQTALPRTQAPSLAWGPTSSQGLSFLVPSATFTLTPSF